VPTGFYKAGQTWDNVFQARASAYEECRAECVGIYLCLEKDILTVFGHEGQAAEDIIYVNWLNMARAGLAGMEFYTPETKKWRQAHMHARYVILQVLLEAGEGLVTVDSITDENGKPDVCVRLDRTKVATVGKKAIGAFLRKLQVLKATANVSDGLEMFAKYSQVDEKWVTIRKAVLAQKKPRQMFVQGNSVLGDEVDFQTFDASSQGMIESFAARFPDGEDAVKALWEAEKAQHLSYP